MLKALRQWREKAAQTLLRSQEIHVVPELPPLAKPTVSQSIRPAAPPKPKPTTLEACGPSKVDFLDVLARLIEHEPNDDRIMHSVEAYFQRVGSPAMLAAWEWESIPASHRQEEDESIRLMIRRSMAESGVRLVGLVLEGQLHGAVDIPVRARLERAEWSLRRGGQTLFHTADEPFAPHRRDANVAVLT